MITCPLDIVSDFPVRKSKNQKEAFYQKLKPYVKKLGYSVHREKGSFGSRNIIIGDPSKAKYLITAHYDTCAWLPFPNLITPENLPLLIFWQIVILGFFLGITALAGVGIWYLTQDPHMAVWLAYLLLWVMLVLMLIGPANPSNVNDNTSGVIQVLEIARTLPANQRKKVCFVLFDLEEAGLIGSSSYRKRHRQETENQIVLNFDCVGEGDVIRFYPCKKVKKAPKILKSLNSCCGRFGAKSVSVRAEGFGFYPSDQKNFPLGVGICALRKNKLGLYLGKIHTPRDKVLDLTNINILRAAVISMISCNAVE